MFGDFTSSQQTPVHVGVKGLDPTIKHFWEARDFRYFGDLDAGGGEQFCGATRRDQLNAAGRESPSEIDHAGLVRHAQQCAADWGHGLGAHFTASMSEQPSQSKPCC